MAATLCVLPARPSERQPEKNSLGECRSRRLDCELTEFAENDFGSILAWTAAQFGEQQARVYSETLISALRALLDGPNQAGVKVRDDIARGVCTIHVARKRRRGRHFVMFRVSDRGSKNVIEVLRLLHDSMDFPRHLPQPDEAE